SLPYPPEAAVVIVGVPEVAGGLRVAAHHDAAGAAIARPRRGHRVFLVVSTRPRRKQTLAIEEGRAVLRVRERPAAPDQRVGGLPLGRQGLQRDLVAGGTGIDARGARSRSERENEKAEREKASPGHAGMVNAFPCPGNDRDAIRWGGRPCPLRSSRSCARSPFRRRRAERG